MFDYLIESVSKLLSVEAATAWNILLSSFIIIGLWFVRLVVGRLALRKVSDPKKIYKWQKNLSYTTVFLGLFLIFRVWFEGMSSLATYLGLLSAGIAIALKDPITDLAGWVFIVWRRPIELGDRVEIGDVKGDVIDLSAFMFTLLEIGNWVDSDQSTGRLIHVSNHRVFTDIVINYTRGFRFIWNEIPVLVTFESDWRKAKTMLNDIAMADYKEHSIDAEKEIKNAAKNYLVFYNVLTPTVYTSVKDSGVMLTIRYITDPRQRRGSEQRFWENILDAFAKEPNIELAYPTTRFFRSPGDSRPSLDDVS